MIARPTRRSLRRFAAAFAGAVLVWLLLTSGAARWLIETADRRWWHEAVKDTVGRWYWKEDWRAVPPPPTGLDYDWLSRAPAPLRIAHALGHAPGTAGANTLAAAQQSLDGGARLLEVDIWLDGAELRCHHGPEAPAPLDAQACTLERLLVLTQAAGAHLVLDIKTDFGSTGEAILARVSPTAARTLIFQLYQPAHLALFARWSEHWQLPGPIVTAYLAHRSLEHLAAAAEACGIRVLTVPVARLPALSRRAGTRVLVHPVSSCQQLQEQLEQGADGAYMPSTLRCGPGA